MSTDQNVLFLGPRFNIELAPLDALHVHHTVRRLFIFRCSSSEQRATQISALKQGLEAMIQRCPILGGDVIQENAIHPRNDGATWRNVVPGRGLELVVRTLKDKLASFEKLEAENFPSSQLPYDLVIPLSQDVNRDGSFPACRLQYTAIDGGTILSWAMSHSIADGAGVNELMRILAEETRLAQQHQSSPHEKEKYKSVAKTMVGTNRDLLRNIESNIPFNISNHPGFMESDATSVQEQPQQAIHPFSAPSPEVTTILTLSTAGLTQLKNDATPSSNMMTTPVSTHDALVALLWRSTLLIRSRRSTTQLTQEELASTTSRFFMPSDARRHLHLPQDYVGNAVYQLAASLDLATLLDPVHGLHAAASAMRGAITAVTPELVSSYMAELNQRWIPWRFMDGTIGTTSVASATDWTSGAVVYGESWGEAFGPVVRFRYPTSDAGYDGNCILPRKRDGGAEMMITVCKDELDMLYSDDCFGRYVEKKS